jgi:hypothetical protein
MKAKKINEIISFQRGKDPEKSLRIGKHSLEKNFLEYYDDMIDYFISNLDMIIGPKLKEDLRNNNLDPESRGKVREILIDYFSDCTLDGYRISPVQVYTDLVGELKRLKNIGEGLEFNRGQDPKVSLGIGYSKYSLENYKFYEYDKVYRDAITKFMDMNEDELYFMGDSRDNNLIYMEELSDYIYNHSRISTEEIMGNSGRWIGVLEKYITPKGRACCLEGIDHIEFFGDIKLFLSMKTPENLQV